MKRKIKGFTLVEIIVTIVVIMTLSMISVPMYKAHTEKVMLAEGYLLLSTIREAEKNYYAEYGNFLYYEDTSAGTGHYTNNETVLGIDARGNKYFTWFYAGAHAGYFYFQAEALKPPKLRETNNTALILQYNVTLGQRISDSPKDILVSWRDR